MEKFFIVTKESELFNEHRLYRESVVKVNELIKKFFPQKGIESSKYSVTQNDLLIFPTNADEKRFENSLCNPFFVDGKKARWFKKTSSIHKEWCEILKEEKVKVIRRPLIAFYFRGYGRGRLFQKDGILYCSYESDSVETPEGFQEIKGSDFYKILEELEKAPT